ncbi:hypothetical protein TGRUB_254760 [Toxoplasma gondii RUB]|uniref:D-glutamate cyclase-like C-terminal domain-containing protein n=12 Tax=Toxoplasma gondii TaxID=5811 RepID=B9QII1_TOXGV|nr:hypothetical protein TGGT1_254760 [Toxoplasma gondii GT1]ESS30439.1 hypothetical protein TGVEG_254760 [Toxoplasma gondii VEG]KAF4645252.1 hypothetical protein TGRH88_003560 [Toxoplasma gondii]KFG35392.1 hypothetical protein TGDOM2_254760 [Toxoplasma gondii GAB2-2007-GAL-DOM2]KFG46649.1 hypothetical protein TGP89_254760 [Toxoplasma gondii p89]KFG53081.1 hypothetical protein TGFOU_254760 [Toxoplasma gondii FOU]KFG59927.1 hypothetical protein TGRUB_254760 [Toxoplasma gondii RUB]KFH06752.1 hy
MTEHTHNSSAAAWSQQLEELLVRESGHHKIKGGVRTLYEAGGKGQLLSMAETLLSPTTKVVAILVGSANCTIMWPPTDTDGPGGAFAITRTLQRLGRQVVLVTDELNHEQVFEALKKANLSMDECADLTAATLKDIPIETAAYVKFACQRNWTEAEDVRLQNVYDAADFILNLGRPGPGEEGETRAHDRANMTAFDSAFKFFFTRPERFALRPDHVATTAVIGELGNELGMGGLISCVKENVEYGEDIGCSVQADFTLVATTANWGAWGLSAMLTLLSIASGEKISADSLLPDVVSQKLILKTLVEEGARCGLTWTRDEIIDRFESEENWKFLNELRQLTFSLLESSQGQKSLPSSEKISTPASSNLVDMTMSQNIRNTRADS